MDDATTERGLYLNTFADSVEPIDMTNTDEFASLLESASPGFTTWNLRGFWNATDRLQLVAGVENFTDKNFREHLDFRSPSGIRVFQPGVNFYFGSELNY